MKGGLFLAAKFIRTQLEQHCRIQLRKWDQEHPFLNHKLLVRYGSGLCALMLSRIICSWIESDAKKSHVKSYKY